MGTVEENVETECPASLATAAPEKPLRRTRWDTTQEHASNGTSSALPMTEVIPRVFDHRRTSEEVDRCKRGQRSELHVNEWGKYGYGGRLGDEVIARPIQPESLPIPRVRRGDISVEAFFEQFALAKRPCIIEGAMDDWSAMQEWTVDKLLQRMRHSSFKVGEDDDGRKLRMKFKYFMDYVKHQHDDSPLYLFETRPEHDPEARKLLDEYEVPDLFPHDFFDVVNSRSKPPFRWWSFGPKRSGTTVHNDPLGTAAWNAVTHGRKRWVIFEPSVPGRLAKGKDFFDKDTEDNEAIMYFDFILPRLRARYPAVRIYEGVQGPGEIIFVPGEWWHGVLNLEDTIAVTQNYCGYDNFDRVWTRTRRERKKLAYLWLRNMRKVAPQLYERARQLNEQDCFLMRHERGPGQESSSSDSSSSSESSSDSSSDTADDLNLRQVHHPAGAKIVAPWLVKPTTAINGVPSPAPPPLPRCSQPPEPTGSPPAPVEEALAARRKQQQQQKQQQPQPPSCGDGLIPTPAWAQTRKRPHAPPQSPEEMALSAASPLVAESVSEG
mmetsp:Transcript_43072/g.85315  ORF Transcript_43072/g.85315 Transcript_43072/m.85315 type:complete len:550 (+) Transcript_43072:50-1699(+)